MPAALDWLGWTIAGLLLVPFVALTFETLAALLPARKRITSSTRPRLAVLIPAHNEEAGLLNTLRAIQPQLIDRDRIVVIADNCTDATAAISCTHGVEAIERTDQTRRGKGYALDFGLKHLAADPPVVVIVIDADTIVQAGTLDALARAAGTGFPIQGVNLLDAPATAGPGARISAFAFYFKNYIRPRGLERLGLPCLLYGTGMALPFDLLASADLAHGDITEDIRLGLELAMAGCPPRFCLNATVTGEMPVHEVVASTQRRRWEHGHMRTLLRHVPRLLWTGITRGQPKLIALACHIGIPPLSLLFMVGALGTALLALIGQSMPAWTLAAGMSMTVLAVLLAWACLGRDRLPVRDLVLLPIYIVKKIPLYLAFLVRPQKEWVRTKRDES